MPINQMTGAHMNIRKPQRITANGMQIHVEEQGSGKEFLAAQ